MYQLRYYNSLKDLQNNTLNYQVVGAWPNKALAYGLRKTYARRPEYSLNLLKVVYIG